LDPILHTETEFRLGKEVGFGKSPISWLLFKPNVLNVARLVRVEGITPLIWLLLKLSFINFDKDPIVCGMLPLNELLATDKYCKFTRLPTLLGKELFSWLICRDNVERPVKDIIEDGNDPLS